jgi:hypothetical protein
MHFSNFHQMEGTYSDDSGDCLKRYIVSEESKNEHEETNSSKENEENLPDPQEH